MGSVSLCSFVGLATTIKTRRPRAGCRRQQEQHRQATTREAGTVDDIINGRRDIISRLFCVLPFCDSAIPLDRLR